MKHPVRRFIPAALALFLTSSSPLGAQHEKRDLSLNRAQHPALPVGFERPPQALYQGAAAVPDGSEYAALEAPSQGSDGAEPIPSENGMTRAVNLHNHSEASDGELTPEALARLLKDQGLTHVALTDHDNVDGVERFVAASKELGIRAYPGVELTGGEGVHILGLGINIYHSDIRALVAEIRQWRDKRADAFLRHLNGLDELKTKGVVITKEEVLAKTKNGVIVEPHIAMVLVDKGIIAHIDDAFKPPYLKFKMNDPEVARLEPKPERAIAAIHAAGGLSFLAHPFTVAEPTHAPHDVTRIREMVSMGLDGIEPFRPSEAISEEQKQREEANKQDYLALAKEKGLLVMAGADYHGPSTHQHHAVVPMPVEMALRLLNALKEPNRAALAVLGMSALFSAVQSIGMLRK